MRIVSIPKNLRPFAQFVSFFASRCALACAAASATSLRRANGFFPQRYDVQRINVLWKSSLVDNNDHAFTNGNELGVRHIELTSI
jgi:hypothetical protein